MARKWYSWYQYGLRPKSYFYDADKDWAVVDMVLNASHVYALSFLIPFDKDRKRIMDGQELPTNYVYWRRVPNTDKESRRIWGKVDRALKRLYLHMEIASYRHTLSGVVEIVQWADLPKLKPATYPVLAYHSHVPSHNQTWIECPSTDSVQERAEDIRLEELKFKQYAYTRTLLGLSIARKVDSYVMHVVNIHKAVMDNARARMRMKQIHADMNRHETTGGTCSTWTSTGKWRNYVHVPFDAVRQRTRTEILEAIHMEKGYCNL